MRRERGRERIVYHHHLQETALIALSLLPSLAAAQQSLGIEQAPTRSLYFPGTGIADGAEAYQVVQNPAALGDLLGLNLSLRHTETSQDGRWAGTGTGLYVAAPVPYLSRLQVGGALEVLRPPARNGVGTSGKLSLSLSYRPLSFLSIGIGYAHLFAPQAPYGHLDTFSLGLRARLGPWLAGALVLHDVNGPLTTSGTSVQRVYEMEILLRPLRDDRLELAAGAKLGEQLVDVVPRARIWGRPLQGVGVGVEGSMYIGDGPLDWRVGVGMELSLAHFGASAFRMFGSSSHPGEKVAFDGGSVAVRASFERYPSLWRLGQDSRLLRIEPGKLDGVAFLELLATLRRLERDNAYGGVMVVLGKLRVGWGRAEELRSQLVRLRRVKKRVFVYAADLGTLSYYVATSAERIYLDPMGSVRITGINLSSWHLKEALDWLGVRADLVRVGAYKSAPETFTQNEPSPAAREQREELAETLYQRLVLGIRAGRKLTEEKVQTLIDHGVFTPAMAKKVGLVDGVITGDEIETALRKQMGGQVRIESPPRTPARTRAWERKAIAVINIEGDIIEGSSRTIPFVDIKLAGGDTLLSAIQEAAQSRNIRAIVLRVESPGGSALVADLLSRMVSKVRAHKPVLCSFGDVAASGGYYLAAPCGQIFTSRTSVTGSIGIFGGKVDAGGLLERLGVRSAPTTRGAHADMDLYYRPYSDTERALLTEQLQHSYDRFVDVVAEGRRLGRTQVEEVARGRVWSGIAAIASKLCDKEGGLMDAVRAAMAEAHISEREDVEIVFYPREQPGLLSQALRLFKVAGTGAQAEPLPGLKEIRDALWSLPSILSLLDGKLMARMELGLRH